MEDKYGNVSPDIRTYVEDTVIPRYDSFDMAHRRDHAETVIAESMELASHYDVSPDMVYVIAAYHDLGLCNGRESHHIDSGRILMEDTVLRRWFDGEQLLTMKEAVEDHRASGKNEPRSIYGKIVSEADRIIDPETVFRRTVQYGLEHYPGMTMKEHYMRFRSHIETKYGEHGYIRLWIPQSGNAERLSALRSVIADEDRLSETFNRIWSEYAGV